MSKEKLKKMILIYPSSFNKFEKKDYDELFIYKKLLPILFNKQFKDNYKWYQIRQKLLQYAHLKRNASKNQIPEIKNVLKDNSTQTKFLFKKEKSTQFTPNISETKTTPFKPEFNERIYELDIGSNSNNIENFPASVYKTARIRKRRNQFSMESLNDTLTDYGDAIEEKRLKRSNKEKGYEVIEKDGSVYTIFISETAPAEMEKLIKKNQQKKPTDRVLRSQKESSLDWVNLK
jgi:hypothetical protein